MSIKFIYWTAYLFTIFIRAPFEHLNPRYWNLKFRCWVHHFNCWIYYSYSLIYSKTKISIGGWLVKESEHSTWRTSSVARFTSNIFTMCIHIKRSKLFWTGFDSTVLHYHRLPNSVYKCETTQLFSKRTFDVTYATE